MLGKLQNWSNKINSPFEYPSNRVIDWIGGKGKHHNVEKWRADKGDRWASGLGGRFLGPLYGTIFANLLAIENEEATDVDRKRNMQAAGLGSMFGGMANSMDFGGGSGGFGADSGTNWMQMGSNLGKLLSNFGGGKNDGSGVSGTTPSSTPYQVKSFLDQKGDEEDTTPSWAQQDITPAPTSMEEMRYMPILSRLLKQNNNQERWG